MATPDLTVIRYEDIDSQVRRYSHHSFLHAAHIRPHASRFHFDAARSILQAADLSIDVARRILEAVLLLHRGLAIHEDVDGVQELRRQLNVLAGDYCSSRYYWIIARTGNETLVQALSDSVVRINESKMTLHRRAHDLTGDEYLAIQDTIHGDLLYTLATVFRRDDADTLAVIKSGVQAYIVRRDVEDPIGPRHFTLRQALDHLTDTREFVARSRASVRFAPVASFVSDSWHLLQRRLDQQSYVEGNR
ncbi:MAG: heptaprenyl diphosphate synthase component 1 [Alicyclobacillus sp.]|nr:heptaprenyl diphosphate synthase component 1 [Alicyclobacillus sp.]